ncbi:MAG: MCP four helix bundle domain-containing protein, partial [Ruminococcus sp.]|nr:MCP four helix bundle domain-containing protein [Ruminococcus sp.]
MKKKKFSINNMAVKAKIVTFSVVMLAFMIIIAGVGLISANRINKAEEERYDNYAMGQFYLSQAFSSAANVEMSIRNMIMLSTDPTSLGEQETLIASYKKEIADQFAKFEANLSEYSKDIVDEYEPMCLEYLVVEP